MGRMLALTTAATTVTNVRDIFQIDPTAGIIVLHSVSISQTSDFGDAEAEGLEIAISRVTDAVTDDVNAVPLDSGDAAESANLAVNETTQLGTAQEFFHRESWNILTPFVFLPAPESRPVVAVGETLVIALEDAPADAIDYLATVVFEQIGG